MNAFVKYLVLCSMCGLWVVHTAKAQQVSLNKIKSWEYWFDSDFGNKVVSAVSPAKRDLHLSTNINTSLLNDGLHFINIRFKDLNGQYSAIKSYFFLKSSSATTTNTNLVAYEYWFDSDYAGRVQTGISPAKQYHLLNSFSTTGLTDGLHIFNIRFKDNLGQYSIITSSLFLINGTTTIINPVLTKYEYWFDQDFANRISASTKVQKTIHISTNIDASSLSSGLHVLNIRFKDDQEQWSTVFSRFFLKNENIPEINNKITAYQYWVDSMSNQINTVWLPASVKQYQLYIPLDLSQIWHGSHTLYIRFADSLRQWSSVYNQVFYKDTLTIAAFSIQSDSICLGDYISLNNQSIDADIYFWDFGDGIQSNDSLPAGHLYTSPGIYTITLTATDTISGDDSVITHEVMVKEPPSKALLLSGYAKLCPGDSVSITADSSANYVWNTGATTQSISVSSAGDYYVQISSLTPPYCLTQSDTVSISILPTYDISDLSTICAGDSIQLPDGTYASTAGLYISNLTTQEGCDSIISNQITVHLIDTSLTQQNYSIWANLSGASYQWLDCDQSFAPITGAVSQGFKPTVNGHYAVQITQGGCTDTSFCYAVNPVGLADYENSGITVFPNPTSGLLNIELRSSCKITQLSIRTISGQLVSEKTYNGILSIETEIPGAHGMYIVELKMDHHQPVYFKVSKQ